jgi:hypothetical protein
MLKDNDSNRRSELLYSDQVGALGDEFIDFMDRSGFAFLEKYTKLQALDNLYNHRTELSAKWCNHSYQRCFRGMVIAGIRSRRDPGLLRQKHRQYLLERGYAGQVIQKFDTNFARAGQISLN